MLLQTTAGFDKGTHRRYPCGFCIIFLIINFFRTMVRSIEPVDRLCTRTLYLNENKEYQKPKKTKEVIMLGGKTLVLFQNLFFFYWYGRYNKTVDSLRNMCSYLTYNLNCTEVFLVL